MRFFSVYRQYIRISFNTAAAYRGDFFFTVIISMLNNLLVPLLTVLIYTGGASIPGWTFHEALLIQAVFMLCTGVCAPLFFSMVWMTMDKVREGAYDLVMLRPGSILLQTVAASFDIQSLGQLIGGLAMFIYALSNLGAPGLMGWLRFALLFLMGCAMVFGCILLMTATTFKWVGNSRIFEIFDAATMFGRYPIDIFTGPLRGVITYIFPVAMLGFFPAAAILGRTGPEMLIACVPCVLFVCLGILIFRRMVYAYQSAGG